MYIGMFVCMYVYKSLHKASAVLQSSNNVTAGIAAHVQDRSNVLSYLPIQHRLLRRGRLPHIHTCLHAYTCNMYIHTYIYSYKYSLKYIYNIRIYIYTIYCMHILHIYILYVHTYIHSGCEYSFEYALTAPAPSFRTVVVLATLMLERDVCVNVCLF